MKTPYCKELKEAILDLVVPDWRGRMVCDVVIEVPVSGHVRVSYNQIVVNAGVPKKVSKRFLITAIEELP